jgi:hypothetical protein
LVLIAGSTMPVASHYGVCIWQLGEAWSAAHLTANMSMTWPPNSRQTNGWSKSLVPPSRPNLTRGGGCRDLSRGTRPSPNVTNTCAKTMAVSRSDAHFEGDLFLLGRCEDVACLESRVRPREGTNQCQGLSNVANVGFTHHDLRQHGFSVGGH